MKYCLIFILSQLINFIEIINYLTDQDKIDECNSIQMTISQSLYCKKKTNLIFQVSNIKIYISKDKMVQIENILTILNNSNEDLKDKQFQILNYNNKQGNNSDQQFNLNKQTIKAFSSINICIIKDNLRQYFVYQINNSNLNSNMSKLDQMLTLDINDDQIVKSNKIMLNNDAIQDSNSILNINSQIIFNKVVIDIFNKNFNQDYKDVFKKESISITNNVEFNQNEILSKITSQNFLIEKEYQINLNLCNKSNNQEILIFDLEINGILGYNNSLKPKNIQIFKNILHSTYLLQQQITINPMINDKQIINQQRYSYDFKKLKRQIDLRNNSDKFNNNRILKFKVKFSISAQNAFSQMFFRDQFFTDIQQLPILRKMEQIFEKGNIFNDENLWDKYENRITMQIYYSCFYTINSLGTLNIIGDYFNVIDQIHWKRLRQNNLKFSYTLKDKKEQKNLDRKLLIISGTHGDENGGFSVSDLCRLCQWNIYKCINYDCDESLRFDQAYQEDQILSERFKRDKLDITVIDINEQTESLIRSNVVRNAVDAMKKLISDETQSAIVFAWCFSSRNRVLINALDKLQIESLGTINN